MKIRLGRLRAVVREAVQARVDQEAWMPGRWYPGAEPMSPKDVDRLNQPLGEEDELDEVDTDPANNPGRPDDAFSYLGMHPDPKAAMSHPFAGGGGGETGVDAADPSEPPTEPTEGE